MRSLTPSYINEMADYIAEALELVFPTTFFIVQPATGRYLRFEIHAVPPKDGYHPLTVTRPLDQVAREICVMPNAGETINAALKRELDALVRELRSTHLLPEQP